MFENLLGKGDHVQRNGGDDEENADNDREDAELAVNVLRFAFRERFGDTVDRAEALFAAALEENRQNQDDRADELNNSNRNFHKNNTPFIRMYCKRYITSYHIFRYDTIFGEKMQVFFSKRSEDSEMFFSGVKNERKVPVCGECSRFVS